MGPRAWIITVATTSAAVAGIINRWLNFISHSWCCSSFPLASFFLRLAHRIFYNIVTRTNTRHAATRRHCLNNIHQKTDDDDGNVGEEEKASVMLLLLTIFPCPTQDTESSFRKNFIIFHYKPRRTLRLPHPISGCVICSAYECREQHSPAIITRVIRNVLPSRPFLRLPPLSLSYNHPVSYIERIPLRECYNNSLIQC